MSRGPRIVSLVPSLTELCFDLGLGKALVGRTDFCIHPADGVKSVPSLGGPKTVDGDRLIALAPTHVLVSPEENARGILDRIARAHAEAVVVHPLSPADNRDLFLRFGSLFGCQARAAELAVALDAALAEARRIRAATPEIPVLPLIWMDPWITVGRDTYVAAMLAAVGLSVRPPEAGLYPRIADLAAAAKAADWILLTSEPYAFTEDHARALTHSLGTPPHVACIAGESVAWYGSRAIFGLRDLIALKMRLLGKETSP